MTERTKQKMAIVVRADLMMDIGKAVAQGSHAALGVVLKIQDKGTQEQREVLASWRSDSFKKVTLKVKSEGALLNIFTKAEDAGLAVCLIEDNGWTFFDNVKTKTCLAILGDSEEVNKVTSKLRLY